MSSSAALSKVSPKPCTTRKPIRLASLQARPQRTDPATNSTSAAIQTRLPPHRLSAHPAGLLRVPLADGTLVATPDQPAAELIPSLLTLSDVMGTGWFAAVAARVRPGMTVAVVGDGAVGRLGVLSARQMWKGEIDPGRVFDLTLPLDQVAEGYRAMDDRRAIKALLMP